MKRLLLTLPMCLAAGTVAAQVPVLDGVVTPEDGYGDLLFAQTTRTQFGDSTDPSPTTSAGGSEFAGMYATIADGKLFLAFTGNLESNFNKWEVYIDSVDGGLNTIGPDTFDEPDSLPRLDFFENALQEQAGLTFDEGFAADYYLFFTNGTESIGGGIDGWIASAHFAELKPISEDPVAGLLGGVKDSGVSPFIDMNNNDPDADLLDFWFEDRGADNVIGLEMGVNNSNVAGVVGSGDDFVATQEEIDAAAAVTTGFEFAIPLEAIGNPSSLEEISITSFINGSNHDFASNQFSGAGVLQGNLAGDFTAIDLSQIAGSQAVNLAGDTGGLVGDLNGDGFVGAGDLDILLGVWNQNDTGAADLNGDGFIGAGDLDILLGNWNAGTAPTSVAAVPEPASLALLGLGGLAMLRRRR